MNNMNKKTYMLPGDERIVAGNAEEFVHELRVGSWMDSDCTDEQYMHNFAERYVVQAGVRIATDTPSSIYCFRYSFMVTISHQSHQKYQTVDCHRTSAKEPMLPSSF